jgi:hypothetical protein
MPSGGDIRYPAESGSVLACGTGAAGADVHGISWGSVLKAVPQLVKEVVAPTLDASRIEKAAGMIGPRGDSGNARIRRRRPGAGLDGAESGQDGY